MQVFELALKVYLLQDIQNIDAYSKIANFIDEALAMRDDLLKLHNENRYKNYCFNLFYPIATESVYKKDNIYTIQLRTIDKKLAAYFNEALQNHHNSYMKGLISQIKIIPNHRIARLYSITPAIMKTDEGYWKRGISIDKYEEALKENLIKKYNQFMSEKLEEDFQLYTSFEFLNEKPIAINYKQIKLLGDKISLEIDDCEMSQKLAYMALGTGILEMNARGAGYVNFKWDREVRIC